MDVAEEADRVDDVGSLDLPGVSVLEPVVGNFNLLAVLDNLLKDAIIVADTVSPGGDLKRGQTVEEAGGKTTETTVAEASVALLLIEVLKFVADVHERIFVLVLHVDVDQSVLHHAAHQKLEGEVVHTLAVLGLLIGLERGWERGLPCGTTGCRSRLR